MNLGMIRKEGSMPWLNDIVLIGHSDLGKFLEMGIPDYLTCLLRNLYAGQEAMVRTGHGTRLVPNWERSMSRLYIVTLLI